MWGIGIFGKLVLRIGICILLYEVSLCKLLRSFLSKLLVY